MGDKYNFTTVKWDNLYTNTNWWSCYVLNKDIFVETNYGLFFSLDYFYNIAKTEKKNYIRVKARL